MEWRGTAQQKAALQKALKQIWQSRRPDTQLAIDVDRFARALPAGDPLHRKRSDARLVLSRTAIARYRDGALENARYESLALLYKFLLESPAYAAPALKEAIDPLIASELAAAPFLAALGVPPTEETKRQLPHFAGVYTMYRRSWLHPKSTNLVTVSQVDFVHRGGQLACKETQDFRDSVSGKAIAERDAGFAFLFHDNLIMLLREPEAQSMKFMVAHEIYPARGKLVQHLHGNMIAVAGKGPHHGYRFYCLRHNETTPVTTGIVRARNIPNEAWAVIKD